MKIIATALAVVLVKRTLPIPRDTRSNSCSFLMRTYLGVAASVNKHLAWLKLGWLIRASILFTGKAVYV